MDLKTVQVCQSAEPYHTMLAPSESHPGEFYTIMVCFAEDPSEDWICSCPGWKFRGYCKHVSMVSPCHWEEGDSEVQLKEERESYTCPRCHGPTKEEIRVEGGDHST